MVRICLHQSLLRLLLLGALGCLCLLEIPRCRLGPELLLELGEAPLELKEDIAAEVLEARLGQRSELLPRLVPLRVELLADGEMRRVGAVLGVGLTPDQLVVHVRRQFGELLLRQPRQLLARVRARAASLRLGQVRAQEPEQLFVMRPTGPTDLLGARPHPPALRRRRLQKFAVAGRGRAAASRECPTAVRRGSRIR